ncbi:hypothetical protein [Nocardia sp. NPDC005825]|uniref:hypothetical protein n=1 Tax=unclassified Nocardia TaxID=2637762 RepID=UPI0033DF6792
MSSFSDGNEAGGKPEDAREWVEKAGDEAKEWAEKAGDEVKEWAGGLADKVKGMFDRGSK